MENVYYLPERPLPITQFLRVGIFASGLGNLRLFQLSRNCGDRSTFSTMNWLKLIALRDKLPD